MGKHLFDKIRLPTLVFSLPTLPYVTVVHPAHRTVVRCQEYCTLRHASLNLAILETYSVVSSRHLCLELPSFHVPTLFVVICVICVYAYNCAYRYKKLGYATRGVPYVSCSRIFQSRIFHPLLYGADNSSPAFSTHAVWCR